MYLRRLKPNKTQEDIEAVLRFVIQSASIHIPAYRELLKNAGLSAASFRNIADLSSFPVTGKLQLFRKVPLHDQLHDRAIVRRCVRTGTSGFSGLPISIYMSKAEAFFRRAQIIAAWRGVTNLPIPLRVADIGTWVSEKSGYKRVKRGPVSIFRVSYGLSVDLQVRLLSQYKPHVISAPPTVIDLLAQHLAEKRTSLNSVRLVASRGEILYAPVKAQIERVFKCPVGDFYNCEEIGNIASECPDNPDVYHVNTDACIVEVVDNDGQPLSAGEEGRILLTNLYNCTMPFIRYEIGDRGTLLPPTVGGNCSCGSRRPRMKLLGGREDDYVFLPNGQRISPRLIGTAVYRAAIAPLPDGTIGWLFRGFQVTQDALDHMSVRVIPEANRSADLERIIASALQKLHPELRCTVSLVEHLPLDPSGKFKKIICSITAGSNTSPS